MKAPDFLYARAWRIIPTYAVGFGCTVAALALASVYFSRPFPFPAWVVAVHTIPGLRGIAGTPVIDYVVWTLEIEVLFYIVCALTAGWIRRRSLLVLLIPTSALILATRYSGIAQVSAAYPIGLDFMFVGVIISFHNSGRMPAWIALAAGSFAAATSLFTARAMLGDLIAFSYAVALALFLVCYFARAIFPNPWPLRALSAISYPLYVVHGVMGYVTMRVALACGAPANIAIIAALALATTLSIVLHVLIELPTQRIGKMAKTPFRNLLLVALDQTADFGGDPVDGRTTNTSAAS
jgi:peptidoglycan/LPS O-acetylase OafA/YrhL